MSSIGDLNLDTIRDQAINGLDTKAIAQMFPENTNAVVTVVTSSVEQDGSKQTIIDFLHRAFIKGDLFCEQISYKGSDSIYQKCQKLPMKLTALPFSSSDPAIAELPHSLQTGSLNALPPPPQIGPMINVNTVAKIAGGLLGSFALYKAVQNLRAEGAINKVRAVAWTAFAIVSFINVKG